MARTKDQVGAKGVKSGKSIAALKTAKFSKVSKTDGVMYTKEKKKRHESSDTTTRRKMREQQRISSVKTALRPTVFARAVRHVLANEGFADMRISGNALFLVQQVTEDIAVRLAKQANLLCVGMNKAKMVMTKHLYTATKVWCDARNTDFALEYIGNNPKDSEAKEVDERMRMAWNVARYNAHPANKKPAESSEEQK